MCYFETVWSQTCSNPVFISWGPGLQVYVTTQLGSIYGLRRGPHSTIAFMDDAEVLTLLGAFLPLLNFLVSVSHKARATSGCLVVVLQGTTHGEQSSYIKREAPPNMLSLPSSTASPTGSLYLQMKRQRPPLSLNIPLCSDWWWVGVEAPSNMARSRKSMVDSV